MFGCSPMACPRHLAALLRPSAAILLLTSLLATAAVAHDDIGYHKNYLIIVKKPYDYDTNLYKTVSSWHASLLASVCNMAKEELATDPGSISRLIYSYRYVVNGFAARVTMDEVAQMKKMDWFVEAILERTYRLMTTHTPQMLGLLGCPSQSALWNKTNMGEGIIIGIMDDGITPGHPSFDGTGMPPPPAKWKGRCDFNSSMCNNKLIGARSFYESARWKWRGVNDPVLPINMSTHGTHTASTAAGAFVPGANAMGQGLGMAAGMAPRAHIAFYQVCFGEKGCDRDDILAGIEDAIEEGVDVLSLSLGDEDAGEFSSDPVALGGYTAIMRGVFISASAGNSGPSASTVSNEAPWLLTNGADTTDRRFVANVKLGNGMEFDGESLFQPPDYHSVQTPLVRDAGDGTCSDESAITPEKVGGKIVLCEPGGEANGYQKGNLLKIAGAAGMLLISREYMGTIMQPKSHPLPATHIPNMALAKIKAYINSTKNPTAQLIFKGTVLGNRISPRVAPFSARGPSKHNQGILKPDLLGPGVNIIAGVPEPAGFATPPNPMAMKFDILSGTSMSTPHISGVVAIIKRMHPTWSPAAIKSALMTTADTNDHRGKPMLDQDGDPANLFALGAGHMNPSRAMQPGLIYNLTAEDYIPYLCGLGYNDNQVNTIIHPMPPVSCTWKPIVEQKDLNYPSIVVILDKEPFTANVSRALTNVGTGKAVYSAVVEVPASVTVKVTPNTLTFRKTDEVQTFTMTFSCVPGQMKGGIAEGQLKWVSQTRRNVVRSPILVSSKKFFETNSATNQSLTHG